MKNVDVQLARPPVAVPASAAAACEWALSGLGGYVFVHSSLRSSRRWLLGPGPEAVKVPEVARLLEAGNVVAAQELLKEIGTLEKNHVEAEALVRLIRDPKLDLEKRPEVLEACFLALRGIGPWSADIYYLMALRRPDVWPVGDLALAVALQEVKRLRRRPDADRQLAISAAWAPWRSVAARLLWHYYLTTRRTRAN